MLNFVYLKSQKSEIILIKIKTIYVEIYQTCSIIPMELKLKENAGGITTGMSITSASLEVLF